MLTPDQIENCRMWLRVASDEEDDREAAQQIAEACGPQEIAGARRLARLYSLLVAAIDGDPEPDVAAAERRRTELDIAAHMRKTDGDWGSVIDDIERSNYQRTTDGQRGHELPDPA